MYISSLEFLGPQVFKDLSNKSAKAKQNPASYACFNPYLPDEKDQAEERRRLKAKLSYGSVSGVFLQMGADLSLLESGLQHLQDLLQHIEHAHDKPLKIHGSVFIPSKRYAPTCMQMRIIVSISCLQNKSGL